jgi:hypothetical protein
MVLKVVLFLAVILALTISAHLLFYKVVIRLFIINSLGLKVSLFVILFLLSISFMASFFLLQWQENSVTIGFYMFSAVWTGLFLNLLSNFSIYTTSGVGTWGPPMRTGNSAEIVVIKLQRA